MLSFFPRGVLDEILNLIESVSEGFPSYSWTSLSISGYPSLISKTVALTISGESLRKAYCYKGLDDLEQRSKPFVVSDFSEYVRL